MSVGITIGSETSYIFIGFGTYRKCQNCNNSSHEIIRQYKVKTTVMYIPVAQRHGNLWVTCSVCEKYEKLGKVGGLFGSDKSSNMLTQKLLDGKEMNKKYYSQLKYEEKQKFLKKLNSFEQYDLVAYIGGQ